jgi:hypothetical protein
LKRFIEIFFNKKFKFLNLHQTNVNLKIDIGLVEYTATRRQKQELSIGRAQQFVADRRARQFVVDWCAPLLPDQKVGF